MPAKRSKTVNQRQHAKRRAAERYKDSENQPLSITRKDIQDAVNQILSGKASKVEQISLNKSIWIVTVKGQKCRVVFDRKRKGLATFLPIDAGNKVELQGDSGGKAAVLLVVLPPDEV